MSCDAWEERCANLCSKPLSPREIAIMELVVEGVDRAKLIAHKLGISEGTTENYIKTIRLKLGASSITQAALIYDRSKGAAMYSGEHPIADGMREYFRRGGRR
jgi:DNA-binding CsgD family transcriptional regulator